MDNRQDSKEDEKYQTSRNLALGIMVPTMLVGCVLVGCGLGYLGDKWLGTGPWLVVSGLILGSMAGVREMMKILKRMNS